MEGVENNPVEIPSTLRKCPSHIRYDFTYPEWLHISGMTSHIREDFTYAEWRQISGMTSHIRN